MLLVIAVCDDSSLACRIVESVGGLSRTCADVHETAAFPHTGSIGIHFVHGPLDRSRLCRAVSVTPSCLLAEEKKLFDVLSLEDVKISR